MAQAKCTSPFTNRYLCLCKWQADAVLAAADELGVELVPPPADLGDGSRLVADADLGAIEDLRPGFIQALRFPEGVTI